MLARLGKYLRALGYDVVWDSALPTRVLADRAADEGRVLLTRNRHAGEQFHPRGAYVVFDTEDPLAQLGRLRVQFALDASCAFTRCLVCNAMLATVDPKDGVAVPDAVRATHRSFRRCPSCDRVYWTGGHVARLAARLGIEVPRAH
jgi:uncharacterized protein